MTDIAELESRITAALDRIRSGVEAIDTTPAAPQSDPAEMQRLQDELEAEKTANAQLEERVKALHSQMDAKVADLERRLSETKEQARDANEQVREATAQASALRKANQHLQSSVEGLRDAAASGATDPHLINQAMTSELEGLRALRDGDRAELDAILTELKPLLTEANDA